MQTYLVANDIQIPFHDPVATRLLVDVAKDIRPHGVVLNGDVVDCYSISDFDKDPRRLERAGLDVEIREAGTLMDALAAVSNERVWLGGNHEDRLRKLAWRIPALAKIKALDFPTLFHLADHGFTWKPYGGHVNLGNLTVTHGWTVRSHSGASARAHLERLGRSVLIGHTHRLGTFYVTTAAGPLVAIENGCLCRLNPEYVQRPDWQQGLSIISVGDGGVFSVQQIPVLKRRLVVYGGRAYHKR